MIFEEALKALRNGAKIRHPEMKEDEYFMGALKHVEFDAHFEFISAFRHVKFDVPVEYLNEALYKDRAIRMVKMKGNYLHPDMPESKAILNNLQSYLPTFEGMLQLSWIMSNEWEIIEQNDNNR